MNNQIRMVLKKRYEAEIADAKYKIKCYSDQELIIPEHPDITGEVDALLAKISSAEDKIGSNGATLWRKVRQRTYYRDLKSFKKKYFFCSKKVYLLYFWSKSIDFINFRVDRSWYKLCF